MDLLDNSSAILQLEETLHMLEESLQQDVFYYSLDKCYIQRLKQMYSPHFDIEHSESGSYYHATLQCIKVFYLDKDCIYQISLSGRFITSMNYLLEINFYALDSNNHYSTLTETLLSLSDLWNLNDTLDIADLLVRTLIKMRADLIQTNEGNL
tara:strand:+ start:973 stop:1431 length:459 start_codon:yes stop_codon:yes gene_type:complete